MKGGKIINNGSKGIVYDSIDLINQLHNINNVHLISINKDGIIKKNIVKTSKIINEINNNILVKKFIHSYLLFKYANYNFKNELNGYKNMIKIFGNNVDKYTTIKEGLIYNGRKIYGLYFDYNYYVFLEKCDNTIDNFNFTQKNFEIFSSKIMKTLKILEYNNFLHNDIKPSNIVVCNNEFKLIDWELSYNLDKQVKRSLINKNGNFIFNHPIKYYLTGLPLLINKIIFHIELYLEKNIYYNKSLSKIREIIELSFKYLNKNKHFYFKYSDYFAFAFVHIYIAEKNNLKISLKIIKPILKLFNIKII